AELAMTPAEGVEAIRRILESDRRPQVVISTGDLNARIAQWVRLETLRQRTNPAAPTAEEAGSLHQRPEMATTFVAPADETERAIAGIWQQFLGIRQIGVYDNFFELGGHSLLATQIISQMRKFFQIEVPLRSILETPTIVGLAKSLKEM